MNDELLEIVRGLNQTKKCYFIDYSKCRFRISRRWMQKRINLLTKAQEINHG